MTNKDVKKKTKKSDTKMCNCNCKCKKYGMWDFCDDHPLITLFSVVSLTDMVINVVRCLWLG